MSRRPHSPAMLSRIAVRAYYMTQNYGSSALDAWLSAESIEIDRARARAAKSAATRKANAAKVVALPVVPTTKVVRLVRRVA